MDNEQNKNFFDRFSEWATAAAGSPSGFLIALTLIIIWAGTGVQ